MSNNKKSNRDYKPMDNSELSTPDPIISNYRERFDKVLDSSGYNERKENKSLFHKITDKFKYGDRSDDVIHNVSTKDLYVHQFDGLTGDDKKYQELARKSYDNAMNRRKKDGVDYTDIEIGGDGSPNPDIIERTLPKISEKLSDKYRTWKIGDSREYNKGFPVNVYKVENPYEEKFDSEKMRFIKTKDNLARGYMESYKNRFKSPIIVSDGTPLNLYHEVRHRLNDSWGVSRFDEDGNVIPAYYNGKRFKDFIPGDSYATSLPKELDRSMSQLKSMYIASKGEVPKNMKDIRNFLDELYPSIERNRKFEDLRYSYYDSHKDGKISKSDYKKYLKDNGFDSARYWKDPIISKLYNLPKIFDKSELIDSLVPPKSFEMHKNYPEYRFRRITFSDRLDALLRNFSENK